MFLKPGLTVIGAAGPELTILDSGSGMSPPAQTVLMPNSVGAPVRLEGLTITGDGAGVAYGCVTTELALVNCHLSNNGGRALSTHARVTMVDCVVSGNEWREDESRHGALFLRSGGEFEAIDTRFEANLGPAITATNLARFSLEGCEVVDHKERKAVSVSSCPDVSIRNTLFLRNRQPTGLGGALGIALAAATVEFCTFAHDSALADNVGAVFIGTGSDVVIRNNTFYRCYTPFFGSALYISQATARVYNNTIVECEGPAFLAGSGATIVSPESGCNLFWQNSENYLQWPAEAMRTDVIVDPLFCDAANLDFRVSDNSPCLPDNHIAECDLIGAHGMGCPTTGTSVIALLSNAFGPIVSGAGFEQLAPGLYNRPIGSPFLIGTLAEQTGIEGERFFFDSWSDGGSLEHEVTVPGSYSEITANFDTEFFVTTLVDSGGTVSPSAWVAAGTDWTITATPQPSHDFAGWLGSGDGSYTGLINPVTVTPQGPLSQKALFLPRTHLLTMLADPGGAVTPDTGPQGRDTVVRIEAIPDPGFEFLRWEGTGLGAYTGTENPADVVMLGPVTQTARLRDQFPLLTMEAGPGGAVLPLTAEYPRLAYVEISGLPDQGYAFAGWEGEGFGSYDGLDNPAIVRMVGAVTEAATFHPVLEMQTGDGGSALPETGAHAPETTVEIAATPDARHVFREWKGSGNGSYSGPSATATVVVNEPLTQVAHFDRVAYELTLSLSDTDPFVHQGSPLGLGKVYLWLACGTSGKGIMAVQATVVGDLAANGIVFASAPGILNAGTARQLHLIASDCIQGPALLGEFTVPPPGDGSLCLSASSVSPPMTVTNCAVSPATEFLWPQDVKMAGVSTGAAAPCSFGRGCGEAAVSGDTPVSSPPSIVLPTADEFAGAAPNPFRSRTSLSFSLTTPARVVISIYDVAGRKVRQMTTGVKPAGYHGVEWNGRDDTGGMVPGGIYFVRLEAGAWVETRKVAFLGVE
ncbi:MAG: hypothetical protein DHS20C21_13730 [Gemmatimonadota bacterium]|nr:MAG: hypothetical protein DHS20C21_13730 [Gemmatimonadota bacterium]